MKLKNLNHENFVKQLESMNACEDGINYIKENKYDLKTFWNECLVFSYLYWYAEKAAVPKRQIVLSAIKVTRINKLPEESEKALRIGEKWALGDEGISTQNLKDAYDASDAAARAAYAAVNDAYAVAASYAAADAAAAATAAAYAAADAAAYAAADAAANCDLKKQEILEIIRGLIEIDET